MVYLLMYKYFFKDYLVFRNREKLIYHVHFVQLPNLLYLDYNLTVHFQKQPFLCPHSFSLKWKWQ